MLQPRCEPLAQLDDEDLLVQLDVPATTVATTRDAHAGEQLYKCLAHLRHDLAPLVGNDGNDGARPASALALQEGLLCLRLIIIVIICAFAELLDGESILYFKCFVSALPTQSMLMPGIIG